MKPRLLDHLVCPIDRTPLELHAWESETRDLKPADAARAERLGIGPAALSHEIVTGVLVNRARKLLYPIHQGVPRLLTFSTGVARKFADLHSERIRNEFPGFNLPNEPSMPGEADVLRSFSNEW